MHVDGRRSARGLLCPEELTIHCLDSHAGSQRCWQEGRRSGYLIFFRVCRPASESGSRFEYRSEAIYTSFKALLETRLYTNESHGVLRNPAIADNAGTYESKDRLSCDPHQIRFVY